MLHAALLQHFKAMAHRYEKGKIKFCIYCPESELLEANKKKYCFSCKDKETPAKEDQFSIPKETVPPDGLQKYYGKMIYCFYCGEELTKKNQRIMCIDGCEVLNIQLNGELYMLNACMHNYILSHALHE